MRCCAAVRKLLCFPGSGSSPGGTCCTHIFFPPDRRRKAVGLSCYGKGQARATRALLLP
jgi:hypothetical protein